MNLRQHLHDERIALTAVAKSDVPTVLGWYEDVHFARLYSAQAFRPHTAESIEKWLEEERSAANNYLFAIRLKSASTLLGIVQLDSIEWSNGTAWLSIAIGDPNNRGKGYGRAAMRLLLNFAFGELNLRRVQLTVFSYNTPALRLYESLGFVHEGTARQALYRDDVRYDMLVYGLLRQEWKG